MTVFGVVSGIAVIIYSIVTMIIGRSLLFGGNRNRYTERSILLFARLSAITEFVAGCGLIVFGIGYLTMIPVVLSWISATIIWISLAIVITLYLLVLEKIKK